MTQRWITLRMPYESALSLQQELSDLTSWCRGFNAGAGGTTRLHYLDPVGLNGAHTLNLMLKEELRKADGFEEDEETVF